MKNCSISIQKTMMFWIGHVSKKCYKTIEEVLSGYTEHLKIKRVISISDKTYEGVCFHISDLEDPLFTGIPDSGFEELNNLMRIAKQNGCSWVSLGGTYKYYENIKDFREDWPQKPWK